MISAMDIILYIFMIITILLVARCEIQHERLLKRVKNIQGLVRQIYIKVYPELEREIIKDIEEAVQGDGTGKVEISGGIDEEVKFFEEVKDTRSDADWFKIAKGEK